MSVRSGDRGQSNLEVLNRVKALSIYSLNAVKNEKNFPKSQRWLMSSKIANEAIDSITCVRGANSIYVSTEEDYKLRRSLQQQAHAHINSLLSLIDVAADTLSLDLKKVEYWTQLCIDADNKLKAWMKSDKEKQKTG